MTDLTREELRALSSPSVPEHLLVAPPAPMWADDCHAWRARADARDYIPDLADCAPMGTKVTEHDRRLLYHGHMRTVRTPAISKALLAVAEPIRANRQREDGKTAIVIDGPRGTGKSTLLDAIGVYWHRRLMDLYGPDENRIPVIALSVPPTGRGNVRNWAGTFARYLGQEREGGNVTASVIHTMRQARTLLVLIDGMERLRTRAETEQTFYELEEISNETGATFIYCGRNAHAIVDPFTRDNETLPEQGETPWGDNAMLRTGRIGFSEAEMAAFVSIVDLFDADLRLFRHERGDLTGLALYLHKRSRGYMRALSQLVCQAAQRAILTGQERITEDLLEQIPLGRMVQL